MLDPMLILPLVLLAVMMFFMWRTNKRNQEKQQELRSSLAPGVEVMTQGGIYGTLVELDADDNKAIIETTPGTRLRVHSATIVNVVAPDVAEGVVVPDDASSLTDDRPVADAADPAPEVDGDERDGRTDTPKA